MYRIEVLPTASKQTSAPGWAYVLDTGLDPSKQPILPTGARKRARIVNYASDTPITSETPTTATSREQTRINKHLAELDKENHRDVQIIIPDRPKDVAQRGLRKGKMTPGVKKIMLSQKTWVNYLADEEAEIALKGYHQPLPPVSSKPEPTTIQPAPVVTKGKVGRPPKKRTSMPSVTTNVDAMDIDAKSTPAKPSEKDNAASETLQNQKSQPDHPADIAYLIETKTPKFPTQAEIDALLSHPPLSFNAARAAPSKSTAPPRKFCEICGYWGRVKCMKCGARICSLECKSTHDETRCTKFFA